MDEVKSVGIQDHPTFKLGLHPSDPDAPVLKLADFLTGVVPVHPAAADYFQQTAFGMYENNRFGVCGPCSVANSRREITARLKGAMVAPSQEDVFDLYRRSGNPRFDPNTGRDDNGVNMLTMLNAVTKGGIGGIKGLAFAKVNVDNIEELQAAVALFGFLLLAVDLQSAQQAQTNQGVWDYQPSGQWGGHAILSGAYASSPEGLDVITWAKRVRMTERFVQRQLSEAWVLIWPEHLTDAGFLAGIDLKALASAYEGLTGKPFPSYIPPPPPPTSKGLVTIDPVLKRISYPAGWTAVQVAVSDDDHDISIL